MNFSVGIFRLLYPSLTWRINTSEKIIYLTFDDGPIPVVTEWVLDELKKYNAMATFFCIGDNVRKHPNIFQKIKDAGHSIGNHTMNHLNGWKTENQAYIENVRACEKYVTSDLFRPPYGRISRKQISLLKDKKIIMWDVLSKDYEKNYTGLDCFERIKSQTSNGSIIVFHDSLKAEERLRVVLPETLRYFTDRSFSFQKLQITNYKLRDNNF